MVVGVFAYRSHFVSVCGYDVGAWECGNLALCVHAVEHVRVCVHACVHVCHVIGVIIQRCGPIRVRASRVGVHVTHVTEARCSIVC